MIAPEPANPELAPLGAWLHQAEGFIRRFVVLGDDQATAIALWVAHTHAFEAAVATPYLSISSAEMESGKTRLLEVLRLLVATPWFTGRTSTAALTRKIDKAGPTLLLDESDPAFKGDKEYAETLRGVLNTGYRKGGAVTVCVGQSSNIDTRDFSTFCPKAIAGIGSLPDTVRSRSIPIRLKKRLTSEPIERFRERHARGLAETIADGLEVSLLPIVNELDTAQPELPDELSDRQQDVWEPLLAIADAAGGKWPIAGRGAAVRLSRDGEPGADATLGVRLLADLRHLFGAEDQMTTQDVLRGLREIEEAPWGSWNDGDGIKARDLSKKLKPYGITSHDLRTPDGTRKGYRRAELEEEWERYLPAPPDLKRDIRDNGSSKPETGPPDPRQVAPPSRIGSPEKPHEQADVADVADRTGGNGENDAREAEMREMGIDLVPERRA